MPEKKTIEKAREDKREGKAPSTQAGEFVREEVHKIRREFVRIAKELFESEFARVIERNFDLVSDDLLDCIGIFLLRFQFLMQRKRFFVVCICNVTTTSYCV